ncbi:hypothetical protein LB553_01200 [Mesorhizobium sp. CA8]|uniref:hypothetical protein n=1 Tax=Mesorhizobium sp. CA8 TaxID=2876637 RepID=UPI001CCDE9F8|nr:hypothetical protein [Mesorhizobium sp. CA8]MBZ9759503.1 hypothetical protein [Mesorhizobium sp. CA8]
MANDLNIPTIADGQADGQWQTSNDADAAVANALADLYGSGVDFSGGNVTLNSTQYRSAYVFKPSAALAAARTLILPAVKRPFVFHNTDATYTVTLKKTDGASPETATSIAVTAGQIFYGYTDGTASGLFGAAIATSGAATPVAYDLPLSFPGTPTAGQLLGKLMVVRDVALSANFSGSYGHVGTNPAATFAIDVQDNGVSIGTISISTGGAFTFTTASGTAKTISAGHRLEFYAPANSPADASIANIAATLKGTA